MAGWGGGRRRWIGYLRVARPCSPTVKGGRKRQPPHIVQELRESRGGRPGLSVPTSLLVSVDVKNY